MTYTMNPGAGPRPARMTVRRNPQIVPELVGAGAVQALVVDGKVIALVTR